MVAADGIISTASDMNQFMRIMLQQIGSRSMKAAVEQTLVAYYRTPYFNQALSWQAYAWPISRKAFLRSGSMATLDTSAKAIKLPSRTCQLFIRTGGGHGYSSIMALLPGQQRSIVILIKGETGLGDRFSLIYQLLQHLQNSAQ